MVKFAVIYKLICTVVFLVLWGMDFGVEYLMLIMFLFMQISVGVQHMPSKFTAVIKDFTRAIDGGAKALNEHSIVGKKIMKDTK